MSFSSLEILPNEILMIIFQYSGDTPNILRAFLGLNQRLNSILLDRRLHLFTNYLALKPLDIYYDSDEFQRATFELVSIKKNINEEKLHEILDPLISYGIRHRYVEVIKKFQILREKCVSVRQTFSEDELRQTDCEIKKEFLQINCKHMSIEAVKRIEELVFQSGACLQPFQYELDYYNFIPFYNHLISPCINKNLIHLSLHLPMYSKLAQLFLLSNPDLINDEFHMNYHVYVIDHYLLSDIFSLRADEDFATPNFLNVRCFRAILDIFFVTLYFHSAAIDHLNNFFYRMIYALDVIGTFPNDLYVRTAQLEVVKLVFEHCYTATIDISSFESFILPALKSLIVNKRFEIFEYVSHHPIFLSFLNNNSIDLHRLINLFISSETSLQVFDVLITDPTFDLFFSREQVLFILLHKKEIKLLEKLLIVYPENINQVDDEGNNPLLFIILYGFGRCDQIIEMLIRRGCDPERKNFNGRTFRDILGLQRNRMLLKILTKYQIIDS